MQLVAVELSECTSPPAGALKTEPCTLSSFKGMFDHICTEAEMAQGMLLTVFRLTDLVTRARAAVVCKVRDKQTRTRLHTPPSLDICDMPIAAAGMEARSAACQLVGSAGFAQPAGCCPHIGCPAIHAAFPACLEGERLVPWQPLGMHLCCITHLQMLCSLPAGGELGICCRSY